MYRTKLVRAGLLCAGLVFALAACTKTPLDRPAAFSFQSVVDAEVDTLVRSGAAVISGINVPVDASVAGEGDPQLVVNDELVVSGAAKVVAGDRVAVQLTSSPDFEETRVAVVTVGGVEASFSVTTRSAGTTPGELEFDPATDVEPGVTVASAPVTLTWLAAPVSIEVAGQGSPELLVNGTALAGGQGTVTQDDVVVVSLTSDPEFGATRVATVTLDGTDAAFSVTTRDGVAPTVELQTDLGAGSTASPEQAVLLSWTVTGDFDRLELTSSEQGWVPVDVTTREPREYQVEVPNGVPSVQYTLVATHQQLPGDGSDSVDVEVPLWVCAAAGDVITFADAELEGYFRAEVAAAPGADLTCADALSVTDWRLPTWEGDPGGVESLVGMQHLRNLEYFWAEFNEISDLTPLADLTSLRELQLDANRVVNLSPIAGLTALELIGFWDNGPVRIGEAGGYPVDVTVACRDGITDISPLANLVNLRTLYLSCNNIADLTPVAGMSQLELAFVISNRIQSIDAFSGAANLQALRFSDNRVNSVTGVFETLTSLRWLEMAYNRLGDAGLVGLGALPDLFALDLEGNWFSDFDPLIDNAAFPAAVGTGDGQEPAVATVSLGYNCIVDGVAVETALVAKGVVVVGGASEPGAQQKDPGACAAGPMGGMSVDAEALRLFQERTKLR